MHCSWSLNSGLYLCGHSAGAHLAAMVLSTDWSEYSVSPQIKGVCVCAGDWVMMKAVITTKIKIFLRCVVESGNSSRVPIARHALMYLDQPVTEGSPQVDK